MTELCRQAASQLLTSATLEFQ